MEIYNIECFIIPFFM